MIPSTPGTSVTLSRKVFSLTAFLLAFSLSISTAIADDASSVLEPIVLTGLLPEDPPAEESEPADGPCLPFITIEGCGGQFSVMTAYIVNPAKPGELLGKPSVNFIHVDLNHGKHLDSFAITQAIGDRLELGYAFNTLDAGDTYEDINDLLGGMGLPRTVSGHSQRLHIFNARYMLIKEGGFDQAWIPAVTAGVHYKINQDIDDLGDDFIAAGLGDFLADQIHVKDDSGFDVTITASKMLTCFPRPVILSAGARSTEAAHVGFFGFTDRRKIVGEFAACVLLSDKLGVGVEYRMKPDTFDIPAGTSGVLLEEDDWWTLEAGYLVNSNLSVSLGYGHFGHLFTHTGNRGFGVAVKYEF